MPIPRWDILWVWPLTIFHTRIIREVPKASIRIQDLEKLRKTRVLFQSNFAKYQRQYLMIMVIKSLSLRNVNNNHQCSREILIYKSTSIPIKIPLKGHQVHGICNLQKFPVLYMDALIIGHRGCHGGHICEKACKPKPSKSSLTNIFSFLFLYFYSQPVAGEHGVGHDWKVWQAH